MIPTLSLANHDQMPAVGLGLWKIDPGDVGGVVGSALEAGYRHLDSACDYGNEAATGAAIEQAVQSGVCRREELWVTSKLWNTYHSAAHVRAALEQSLKDLRVDYLDLFMIHFPISLQFVPFETRYPPGWLYDPDAQSPRMIPVSVPIRETWEAMQDLVREGLVRNLGICNFNVSLIRDLLTTAEIRPSVLQVELHPYLTQDKLLRYCAEQEIAVVGFSPLGAPSYVGIGMATEEESVLEQPLIREIAERHDKSPAQVVLRWGVQRGTAVIPKTSRPERLTENAGLFDFELSDDEMSSISGLNQNRRFNDPGVFCEQAFHTFFPIYE